MTLFSFLFAMLLEQFRPVRAEDRLGSWIPRLLHKVEKATNTGAPASARWAWFAVVVGGTILTWLVVALLMRVHVLLGFLATIGVLYLTIGFRQFSNRFTEIQLALAANDLDRARAELRKWTEYSGGDLMTQIAADSGDASAISREAIRLALVSAQRHVFGVIFWFVILPGPAGAVLYRLSAEARRCWADAHPGAAANFATAETESASAINSDAVIESAAIEGAAIEGITTQGTAPPPPVSVFGEFAVKAFSWVDWFPARVTAMVFAVVGNFEDSILMWRAKSGFPPHANDTERVILSAGAGAMGVRLSVPDAYSVSIQIDEPAETEALGGAWPSLSQNMPFLREADESSLRSAVGLVWRSVILWVVLMLLVSLGHWLG
jgi:adenosylcobinamide-phosphate synthase